MTQPWNPAARERLANLAYSVGWPALPKGMAEDVYNSLIDAIAHIDAQAAEIERLKSLLLEYVYESDGDANYWCQVCKAWTTKNGKPNEPHADGCIIKKIEGDR